MAGVSLCTLDAGTFLITLLACDVREFVGDEVNPSRHPRPGRDGGVRTQRRGREQAYNRPRNSPSVPTSSRKPTMGHRHSTSASTHRQRDSEKSLGLLSGSTFGEFEKKDSQSSCWDPSSSCACAAVSCDAEAARTALARCK
jgi:hypothetical protein